MSLNMLNNSTTGLEDAMIAKVPVCNKIVLGANLPDIPFGIQASLVQSIKSLQTAGDTAFANAIETFEEA